MPTDLEALRQLLDRQQIIDLLNAYCRAVDACDPPRVAALFTDDCVVDFGPGLTPKPIRSATELARALRGLSVYSATSHHISNHQIVFESDDLANGVTYLHAWHRFAEQPKADAIVWGQYHDLYIRTTDGWRISERRLFVAGQQGFSPQLRPIQRSTR